MGVAPPQTKPVLLDPSSPFLLFPVAAGPTAKSASGDKAPSALPSKPPKAAQPTVRDAPPTASESVSNLSEAGSVKKGERELRNGDRVLVSACGAGSWVLGANRVAQPPDLCCWGPTGLSQVTQSFQNPRGPDTWLCCLHRVSRDAQLLPGFPSLAEKPWSCSSGFPPGGVGGARGRPYAGERCPWCRLPGLLRAASCARATLSPDSDTRSVDFERTHLLCVPGSSSRKACGARVPLRDECVAGMVRPRARGT